MPYMRPKIKRTAKAAFGFIGYTLLLITGGLWLFFANLAAGHPSIIYTIINYGLMFVFGIMMLFAVPFTKITQERFGYFFLFILSSIIITCFSNPGFLPVVIILLIGAWAAVRGGLQSIMPCIMFLTFTVFVLDYAAAVNWVELSLLYACILICAMLLKCLHRISEPASIFLKFVAYAVVFCCFFIVTLTGLYFTKMGINALSANDINVILQSNPEQMGEFIFNVFSAWNIFVLFTLPAIGILFFARLIKGVFAEKEDSRPLIILFYVILTVFFISRIFGMQMKDGALNNIYNSYISYKNAQANNQAYLQLRSTTPKPQAQKREQGETYLLIIDDSASRDRLSPYGYSRDTAPWLNAKRKDDRFIFFNNAYSAQDATALLNTALTANNSYSDFDKNAPAITDLLSAAGFNTYWFSNQERYPSEDNPLTALAQGAKYIKFLDYGTAGTDDMLLPYIKNAMLKTDKNANNFIVVHLSGTREDFKKRLPKNFAKVFSDGADKAANEYDGARVYTDGVIQQIYNMVQKATEDKTNLIYVSANGAQLNKALEPSANGQTSATAAPSDKEQPSQNAPFDFDAARIPLVVAVSPQFVERYPQKTALLKQNTDKIFTADLLFDLIVGLSNTETPHRDPKFDLSDKKYSITPTNALIPTLNGKNQPVNIADDPTLIRRANMAALNQKYPLKFAAAVCKEQACTRQALNAGFTAIAADTDAQSLPKYLQTLPDNLAKVVLNINDLTSENIPSVIEALNAAALNNTAKTLKLKNKLIIQSDFVGPQITAFPKNGWQTSFYYDPQTAPKQADELAEIIREQRAAGITLPAASYTFIRWQVLEVLPPYIAMHVITGDKPDISAKDYFENADKPAYTRSWRTKTVIQDFNNK